jgi:hypothetical protein
MGSETPVQPSGAGGKTPTHVENVIKKVEEVLNKYSGGGKAPKIASEIELATGCEYQYNMLLMVKTKYVEIDRKELRAVAGEERAKDLVHCRDFDLIVEMVRDFIDVFDVEHGNFIITIKPKTYNIRLANPGEVREYAY